MIYYPCIVVAHGEMKYRYHVVYDDKSPNEIGLWTDDIEEAATIFEMAVKRVIKHGRKGTEASKKVA